MNIYVDVDNTITKTDGMDYKNAKPLFNKIAIINKLYDDGHTITYWTARGSVSGINYYDLTKKQLDNIARVFNISNFYKEGQKRILYKKEELYLKIKEEINKKSIQ